ATEPVSLAEAKAHLRVDFPDDDQMIAEMISTARMRVESRAYLRLITQTLALSVDRFPYAFSSPPAYGVWPYTTNPRMSAIELPPPVQSITSITYDDPSGTVQTLSPTVYDLEIDSLPALVFPQTGQVWPATTNEPDAVLITFVAGFGSAAQVPPILVHACKLLIGHYYNNREQILSGTRLVALEIPEGFDDLIAEYGPALIA